MAETVDIEIDLNTLLDRLSELQNQAKGDMARVIELLLLENYVLALGQSTGFRRGVAWDFSEVPRFLKLDDGLAGE